MKELRAATWGMVFALFGFVALCIANPAPAPQSSAINQAIDQRQLESLGNELDEDKRAWQNLNGGWGKRGWQEMNSPWGKRAWQNLHGGWGKRAWQDMNTAWGKRAWKDMNSAWGKRAWNNLNGGWGKRDWSSLHGGWGKRDILEYLDAANPQMNDKDMYENNVYERYVPVYNNAADGYMNEADDHNMDKKSGPSNSKDWTKLSAMWGKREPGWNNLKGLWGKRSSPDSMDDSLSEYADRRYE